MARPSTGLIDELIYPPRVCSRPDWSNEESGIEAIELADSISMKLDNWEKHAVRVALAENDQLKWAAPEFGLLVARQNGKGVVFECIGLHGLFIARDPYQIWTSNEYDASREAFVRIKGWIESSGSLMKHVKRMPTAPGTELIELYPRQGEKVGPRFKFAARTKAAGRSRSPSRVFFDEAQDLSVISYEGLHGSLTAQPNWQACFGGTVPNSVQDGGHWTGLRDRGRSGADPSLAWIEYSPAGSEKPETARMIDLSRVVHWLESNPSCPENNPDSSDNVHPRKTKESLEAALRGSHGHTDSFGREHLSIWPGGEQLQAMIKFDTWTKRKITGPIPEGISSFGVKFSADGRKVAVAGGRKSVDETGRVQVYGEVIGQAPIVDGTGWLVDWLVERWRSTVAIMLDGRAGALALYEALRAEKVPERVLIKATTEQAIAAPAALIAAIGDGTFSHGGQPGLDAQVKVAGRRAIGNTGGWGFGPITPDGEVVGLDAIALANFAALTSKRDPRRRSKVGF